MFLQIARNYALDRGVVTAHLDQMFSDHATTDIELLELLQRLALDLSWLAVPDPAARGVVPGLDLRLTGAGNLRVVGHLAVPDDPFPKDSGPHCGALPLKCRRIT